MFYVIDKMLGTFQPYIPLMQTLVWPIFIIVIALIFRKTLGLFIETLRKRIEDGSPLEALGVKLGSKASQAEVDEKVKTEVAELQVEEETTLSMGQPESNLAKAMESARRNARVSMHLAEQLIIAKLAAERNLKIEQHVRTDKPGSFVFDGIAFVDKNIIAIEVKYVQHKTFMNYIIYNSLNQINTAYMSLDEESRKKFSLILALVVDREFTEPTENFVSELAVLNEKYKFPVEVIAYRMDDLKKEFKVQ